MSLTAFDLLAAVATAFLSAHACSLDRLGIHYAGARLKIFLHSDPQAFPDYCIDPFPGAVDAPLSEVVVDSLYANDKKDGEDPPVRWELRNGSPLPRR